MKGLKFVLFTMMLFLSAIATADQSKVTPVTATLLAAALTDGKSGRLTLRKDLTGRGNSADFSADPG